VHQAIAHVPFVCRYRVSLLHSLRSVRSA
jgi:hypothetical protein